MLLSTAILLTFCLSIFVTMIVRIVLQLSFMDYNTGFYIGSRMMPPLFYGLIILTGVVLWFFYMGRPSTPQTHIMRRPTVRITSIIVGFFVIATALFHLVTDLLAGKLLTLFASNIFNILYWLVSIAAGLAFWGLGTTRRYDGEEKLIPTSWAAAILVWQSFGLLRTFLSYRIILTVSDNLLHLLLLTSSVVFLLGYLKMLLHLTKKDSPSRAAVFGLLTCYLGFVFTIPRFLVYYVGQTIHYGPPMEDLPALIAFSFFAGAVGLEMMIRREKKPRSARYMR